ncbi:MAG TPA: hypothetical protein VNV36_17505 [Pseudomonas sp.]|uniref:hypothetical protein n=1 Tax=Pseudomonas sp. TaxID=306 RepID=UPI002BF0624A|nr:hypothetical protein [Pseudomonas sp.]HWH88553.1 hypothetical protein [Pseudomonas sp.]
MFSHESIPLIIFFIILLLGALAAALHPLHALISWLRRRSERANASHARKVDSR